MTDFDQFEIVTFDCYGTLIDWENGIINGITPVLESHGVFISSNEILEAFSKYEPEIQSEKYSKYRVVLREIMKRFGRGFNFSPTKEEELTLENSLNRWLPFQDTTESLNRLQKRYKIAIISNIDNDLFAISNKLLAVKFDYVSTAEECKTYKPSHNNFLFALKKMNIDKSKILHVAQSIHHDIAPTNQLGITNVWINRRHNQEGFGATCPSFAEPKSEFSSLEVFVKQTDL